MPPLFDWLTTRSAGILAHPTSFPGNQGIGTLDGEVDRFLDFLERTGAAYWQICPLGPTGYGDSPYQCFSAFAGNPYLVDLAPLVRQGLLESKELAPLAALDPRKVDFGALYRVKMPLLFKAAARHRQAGRPDADGSGQAFRETHREWLRPYALFSALKAQQQGRPWWEWPAALRDSRQALAAKHGPAVDEAVEANEFIQHLFFGQWKRVRTEAARRKIAIIGDIPIFVAADSADAWANPDVFDLDPSTGRPRGVAGVPPDYFSADGQLWGNPLYDWKRQKRDGYAWWLSRMRSAFALHDVIRIDHFRGFEAYWRIPGDATNARQGEWIPGPGLDFFQVLRRAFPDGRIIAEDLGLLTPAVIALRDATGLPGMAVLQFAFGGKADNLYLPHNLAPNSVIYPGTHDNDTTQGWYRTASEPARDHVRRYLRVDGREIGWDFIRAAYASVSRLAVIPLQDVMNLGSEARFNTPGKPDGNWQWRFTHAQLDSLQPGTADYLRSLAEMYGRLPASAEPAAG